ncbi:MAG: hypothetical protein ACKO3G_04550 [Planctomycetaceae bacterium]
MQDQDLKFLTTAQIQALGTDQIPGISVAVLASFSSEQIRVGRGCGRRARRPR